MERFNGVETRSFRESGETGREKKTWSFQGGELAPRTWSSSIIRKDMISRLARREVKIFCCLDDPRVIGPLVWDYMHMALFCLNLSIKKLSRSTPNKHDYWFGCFVKASGGYALLNVRLQIHNDTTLWGSGRGMFVFWITTRNDRDGIFYGKSRRGFYPPQEISPKGKGCGKKNSEKK